MMTNVGEDKLSCRIIFSPSGYFYVASIPEITPGRCATKYVSVQEGQAAVRRWLQHVNALGAVTCR